MIRSKKDLEDKVLEYSPELRNRIENGDETARSELERIADRAYDNYKPFIGGAAQTTGKVGRVLGYAGDAIFFGSVIAAATNPLLAPYMLTGLLLKKVDVAAQIPEAVKTVKYGIKTGDYIGAARNMGAKALSYVPGATIVDRGLSKIAQKRMIRRTAYEVNEAIGEERKPWHARYAEQAEEAGYSGVEDRSHNVLKVHIPNRQELEEPEYSGEDGIIKVDFTGKKKLANAA